MVARHRFRQRSQRADETIPQFLSALRELASSCAYADMESEMLRDQLVERSYAPTVRDRLLLEPSLTLDSAVTIACQVEQALFQTHTCSVRKVQFMPWHPSPFGIGKRARHVQTARNLLLILHGE